MKKVFVFFAAMCCAMVLSATTYTCHLKVTVNGTSSEQDEVMVEVTGNNGVYDLSLKNFCLVAEGVTMPVGNIEVNGVEGVDEYGYTTIRYNNPVAITPGDDGVHLQDEWIGPMLGEVPIDLTARFTETALDANIDITLEVMGQVIGVQLFGIAPATAGVQGDVNKDGEVNISDVNSVIDIILKN